MARTKARKMPRRRAAAISQAASGSASWFLARPSVLPQRQRTMSISQQFAGRDAAGAFIFSAFMVLFSGIFIVAAFTVPAHELEKIPWTWNDFLPGLLLAPFAGFFFVLSERFFRSLKRKLGFGESSTSPLFFPVGYTIPFIIFGLACCLRGLWSGVVFFLLGGVFLGAMLAFLVGVFLARKLLRL